jgi:hypothetical protein
MTTEVLGRSQTSACDGVTTAFPVDLSFKADGDLKVYLLDALADPNEAGTLLVEGDDYTIDGVGADAAAEVNTAIAYPAGKFIRRWRETERDQEASYVPNDGFPAKSHETQLDRLSRITEEHDDDLARTIRAPAGEATIEAMPTIAERRGQLLAFTDDANADPIAASGSIIIAFLADVLRAGVGIQLVVGTDTITIVNTVTETGGGAIDAVLLSGDQFDGEAGAGGSTAEDVRDIIGTTLQGLGCVVTVDDAGNTVTIDLTQAATAEVIRDVMGLALTPGNAITITPNDPGDTIAIAVSTEAIQDMIATFLVAGTGISFAYNDAGNQLTITNTGLDASYKGIVPTVRNAAFNFDNTMNGRATDWTGGAADATIRLDATFALDAGWCHRIRNSGVGVLNIHRADPAISLVQPSDTASGDVGIPIGAVAFIECWGADDFTISVSA